MGKNNRIDACYMTQAQNLFKQLGIQGKGKKVENASSLFGALNFLDDYDSSKKAYFKEIDTDKDNFISEKEFAYVLQRADKQGRTGDNINDKNGRNNQVVDAFDLNCDFAKNGARKFLLDEAKKQNPEKYQQIKERLMKGNFTVTGRAGESEINLLQQPTDGKDLAAELNEAVKRYEGIGFSIKDNKQQAIAARKFLDRLADGQIVSYDVDSEKKTITFFEDKVNHELILRKEQSFDLVNPQNLQEPKGFLVGRATINSPEETLDKDFLEKTAAKAICDQVLAEQLRDIDNNILEAIDNPQNFSALVQKLSSGIKKTLGVKTSVSISDNVEKNGTGFYNRETDEIEISYSQFKSYKDHLEKTGTLTEKLKQQLVKHIIGTITHEYWHSKQNTLTTTTPAGATPQEIAIIKKYSENNMHYLTFQRSLKFFGSTDKYTQQPKEKSAFDMETDIYTFIDKWYANKK